MWAPFQISQGNPLVDQTFPLAVQTLRLFEALLAMCHACYGRAVDGSVRSGRARYRRSHVVRMIENAMLASVVDDAMIMTLLYMMELDFCCDDKAAYEARRQELWQVIERRGGLGHCGLHDSLKSSLLRSVRSRRVLDHKHWICLNHKSSTHVHVMEARRANILLSIRRA